jgi:hypothetical protein
MDGSLGLLFECFFYEDNNEAAQAPAVGLGSLPQSLDEICRESDA